MIGCYELCEFVRLLSTKNEQQTNFFMIIYMHVPVLKNALIKTVMVKTAILSSRKIYYTNKHVLFPHMTLILLLVCPASS